MARLEETMRHEAKAFIRRLRYAVPMVMRKAKPEKITSKL